jgi:hypothetical protein
MSFEGRKPMATALACPHDLIASELARGLSQLSAVGSVHFLPTETALSVWVGVGDGHDELIRKEIYHFEDHVSEKFPSVIFDFHIVTVPTGRKVEDFLSAVNPIFERHVA